DKRHISKYLWHSLLSYTQACTRTHVLHFLDEVQENDIAPACSAKPISSGPISAESGPRRLFTPPSPPPTSQAASATFQKTPTSCHTSIRRRRRRHLLPLSSHSDETLFSIHLSIHGVARPRHPGRPRRRPPPGSGRAPPRPAPPRPARLRHHLLPAPVRALGPACRFRRPLAALMGSPVTVAAVMARLTAHPGASARACCELSQGT
uniref:Uncharacterized protein n=1 Tax=Zea mays TaxID=4577 RepID=A0A804LRA3_MAIZE